MSLANLNGECDILTIRENQDLSVIQDKDSSSSPPGRTQ
jgi:hypothetical protein